MASEAPKECVANVKGDQEEATLVKHPEKETATEAVDSQEGSDIEETCDEEIVLDEPSDTENYVPPDVEKDEDDAGDDSCSSGEEEEGVTVQEVHLSEGKFYKLKFKDVEATRMEFVKSMEAEEQDDEDEEVEAEEKEEEDDVEENKENIEQGASFKEYRPSTILDEDMESEEEDPDFDPVYCGETLSDVEYTPEDKEDTESEPETEEMEGQHKKTGETLVCIKMIEQLQIPPRDESCSSKVATVHHTDHLMECS